MRILRYIYRRDMRFDAELVCEHCKRHVEIKNAADDTFFRKTVLPTIVCAGCKKNSAGELESAKTLDAARAQGVTPVHL